MEEFQIDLKADGDFLDREFAKYEIIKANDGSIANTYHVRIDGNIESPENYRKHFELLRSAGTEDEIVFHISSYGGFLDTAVNFVYAMLDTKANTKAVVYTAASAATLIAYTADEVEIKDIGTHMLHNFSTQQQGKGQELRDRADFDDRQFRAMCDLLYKGILTTAEAKKLQKDKDFWFLGSEVADRMKKYKWKSVRSRLNAKA